MALSRIIEVSITRVRLTLPSEEFVHLPAQMGVTVVREGDALRLTTEQPRCALVFHLDGDSSGSRGRQSFRARMFWIEHEGAWKIREFEIVESLAGGGGFF